MDEKRVHSALTRQRVPVPLGRGEERKRVIVQATVTLLAREGLPKLTFEAVGKSCGIGKSHVAYHFPSLEHLVLTAVSYVWSVGQGIVAEALEKEKKKERLLRTYIEGTFLWIERHPEHASVAGLLGYLATWDKTYRKVQTEIRDVGRARVTALLQARSGKKAKSHAVLAESIQSLLMGQILYYFATNKTKSLGQARRETWEAIERLL